MLKVEYPYNNNENLIRHYSDEGYLICQMDTGIEYMEAVDVYPCKYTYVETEHLIPQSPQEMEE